eukprot:gnl/Spiro4/11310_TR5968_c0_g1_i1.p1 gnl/Spiro4/11310_TR5968_c0_g1~~gnl/Spiro4/11310_TR5968_c0_g1_i1.p1  ORF type:complete len:150 (+),score=29.14 gnl/Spiro4/11310_TR5968_c0_g1_i1:30-452(+)
MADNALLIGDDEPPMMCNGFLSMLHQQEARENIRRRLCPDHRERLVALCDSDPTPTATDWFHGAYQAVCRGCGVSLVDQPRWGCRHVTKINLNEMRDMFRRFDGSGDTLTRIPAGDSQDDPCRVLVCNACAPDNGEDLAQ